MGLGSGALTQQRSSLSVSIGLKRPASWPQGFLDRPLDPGPVETRFRGAKKVPEVQFNLSAMAQSGVSGHSHAFILTGGRGVRVSFRKWDGDRRWVDSRLGIGHTAAAAA
jgi:hypothetical protein